MKIPTMGQIVLFHFHECGALTTRPACVIEAEETGHCDLNVFYGRLEYRFNRTDRAINPLVRSIPIAPDGVPADCTWTFRPEDL